MFIASEVMFFVAWFWAFFDASLFAGEAQQVARVEATGGHWPPAGMTVLDPWHLPLLNTLILLTSGTTVTWAHHALLHNDRQGLKWGLVLTIVLGVLFTAVQAYEYSHAAFAFSGNIYGSTFFMATGFHGFHVIIGTLFLIVCLLRALRGDFTPQKHFGFEAAAWYWHFVDVVWLFLFVCIYVWGFGRTLPLTRGHGPLSPPAADRDGAQGPLPALRRGPAVRGIPDARAALPGLRARLWLRGLRRRPGRLRHPDRRLPGGRRRPRRRDRLRPPIWVHAVLWGPLVLVLCLGLLRPLKGVLVALQYANKAGQGGIDRPTEAWPPACAA